MKKFRGFTLAEILITLSIIGIVAAIMIPSLLVNVNDKAYDAQRKALHARMAQAIGQLDDMNAYESLETGGGDKDSAVKFITNGLNRVYKISTVCESTNLGACDIPTSVKKMGSSGGGDTGWLAIGSMANFTAFNAGMTGGAIGDLETKPAGFRTTNGESVMVFYNPKCTDKHEGGSVAAAGSDPAIDVSVYSEVCVNMVYDLNGASKTPNQVGKDIGFITVVNASTPTVVAPKPSDSDLSGTFAYYGTSGTTDAAAQCKSSSQDLVLPDREQLISLVVNQNLIGNLSSGNYWSGTIVDPGTTDPSTHETIGTAWAIDMSGKQWQESTKSGLKVRCIKK